MCACTFSNIRSIYWCNHRHHHLKKLKLSVENLHSEKVKLEKQNAKKPAGKAKGKVTLKKESDVSIENFKLYIKLLNIFLIFFIQGY